jgi:hypothetical protein
MRTQIVGAERAIEAHRQRPRMAHRVIERLGGLPDKVRPERSVMVPEIITGIRAPRWWNSSLSANSAALAFKVSKIVSTMITSAPPSIRPLADSV